MRSNAQLMYGVIRKFFRLLVLIVNLIDLFTVSVAILVEGKHGKIYNKCMEKVGSLMLYNLRKVDILKFL